LPRKRFLCPAFLTGLHVEAVLLDFLDDVFLLHLALETPQCVFQRLALLNDDFGHCVTSPQSRFRIPALQSLAVAGPAHFNYRMPSRAWSLFAHRLQPSFSAIRRTLLRVYALISIHFCEFCQEVFTKFRIFPLHFPPHCTSQYPIASCDTRSCKSSFQNDGPFLQCSCTLLLPAFTLLECPSPLSFPSRRTLHDGYARCPCRPSRRRSGRAFVPTYARSRQACRSIRRLLSDH